MRRTTILAVLAAAACAAPASAQTPTFRPADSYPQLGHLLPTARAAWPNSPCRDREEIAITDTLLGNPPPGALGGAARHNGRCLVMLKPLLFQPGWEYGLCITLTHELGHLAGREHTSDPTDLMYPSVDAIRYAPCWHATKPTEPEPGPVVITPDQELQIVQGGEHRVDEILTGRYGHYRGEATCEYEPPPVGERSPTLTCTAKWRTKKRRYRATVLLREGVEDVSLKTRRVTHRR